MIDLFSKIKNSERFQRQILLNLLDAFLDFNVVPIIGIEIEFYLTPKRGEAICEAPISERIIQSIGLDIGQKIHKERGCNQYEIALQPVNIRIYSKQHIRDAFASYLDSFVDLKQKIQISAAKYQIDALFYSKPFSNDFGSALQINLSLFNFLSMQNLFDIKNLAFAHDICIGREKYNEQNIIKASIIESAILIQVINAILNYIPCIFPLILHSADCFQRLNGAFLAPSNISWGINNRTTLLRVPSIGDRRIEFRLPSAESNVYSSTIGLLAAVLEGFTLCTKMSERKLNKSTQLSSFDQINHKVHEPIYGNAYDEIYSEIVGKLPMSFDEAYASASKALDMNPAIFRVFSIR